MIDPQHLASRSFVQVHFELIEEWGIARAAVISLVHFRCQGRKDVHEDEDGRAWWRASIADLAKLFSYSPNGMTKVLDGLVRDGALVREKFRLEEWTDQTYSYRVLLSPQSSESNVAKVGMPDPNKVVNVPISDEDEENTLIAPEEDERDPFDEWWQLWPKKVGRSEAERAFSKVMHKTMRGRFAELVALTRRYAIASSDQEKRYLPNPATWLNQSRWLEVGEQEAMRLERDRAAAKAPAQGPRPQTFDRAYDDTQNGRPLLDLDS
jgi:hypothetical protein